MSIHDESRGAVWGWASAPDADVWTGAGKTRKEALAYAQEQFDADGGYGYICEGRYLSAGNAAAEVVNLEEVLDRLAEIEEVMGFDESPFEPKVSKPAAQAALEEAIRAWADAHLTAGDRFTLVGVPQAVTAAHFDS